MESPSNKPGAAFRSGMPMRLSAWLTVAVVNGPLAAACRSSKFVRLDGEVLTLHFAENEPPEKVYALRGARVSFPPAIIPSNRRKEFKIIFPGGKSVTIRCDSFEEMATWAHSIHHSIHRAFDLFYSMGPLIADGTYSKVHYCYPLQRNAQTRIAMGSTTTSDTASHFLAARSSSGLTLPGMSLDSACSTALQATPSTASVCTDQVFAVKVIKLRAEDIHGNICIERERHINAVLKSHNNLVQAVDVFATVDRVYIVMEHMRGGTLEDLLERHSPLPERHARVVMRDLLRALTHIHEHNIVHRDVRPSNLFCSEKKFPMALALGDFGSATFIPDKRVNRDVLSSMLGADIAYTATEITRKQKYGPAVDLWSAGVLMYRVLSGSLPFKGQTDRAVFEAVRNARVSMDEPVWDTISCHAKSLVRQLLHSDPHKRISALAAAHHAWFTSTPPPSVPVSAPASLPTGGFPRVEHSNMQISRSHKQHACPPREASPLSLFSSTSSSESSSHGVGVHSIPSSPRYADSTPAHATGALSTPREKRQVSAASSVVSVGVPQEDILHNARGALHRSMEDSPMTTTALTADSAPSLWTSSVSSASCLSGGSSPLGNSDSPSASGNTFDTCTTSVSDKVKLFEGIAAGQTTASPTTDSSAESREPSQWHASRNLVQRVQGIQHMSMDKRVKSANVRSASPCRDDVQELPTGVHRSRSRRHRFGRVRSTVVQPPSLDLPVNHASPQAARVMDASKSADIAAFGNTSNCNLWSSVPTPTVSADGAGNANLSAGSHRRSQRFPNSPSLRRAPRSAGLAESRSQKSRRSLRPVSSSSNIASSDSTPTPRLVVSSSMRRIQEEGLHEVARENPALMKRFMSSKLFQSELSTCLPFRRKLIVTARAFIAVFRMMALVRGHSLTRQLSAIASQGAHDRKEHANEIVDKRKQALKKLFSGDKDDTDCLESRTFSNLFMPRSRDDVVTGRRPFTSRRASRDAFAKITSLVASK